MLKDQKTIVLVAFAALSVLIASGVFAGDVTILYPSKDDPVFSVTAPEDWEMTPAEEEGDYFTLEGPTGAVLSFRAIPGTKEDLEDAVQDGMDYIKETYAKVQLGEAQPFSGGVDGFRAAGTGAYKDDGTPCVFELGWFTLKSGHIAELWYEAESGDEEGAQQAKQIISSFKGM